MNIAYLYLAHVAGSPAAPLLGFASATMTLSKTVLYWLQEYYCGGCAVGHNDLQTLVVYWIIPNGCASCSACRDPSVDSPRSVILGCGCSSPATSSGAWARTSAPRCTLLSASARRWLRERSNERYHRTCITAIGCRTHLARGPEREHLFVI